MRKIIVIIAACLLAACAPEVQDTKPVAAQESAITFREWLPSGKPRAVIVAVHGFNDYSNAFAYAGEFFKTRGVAVPAYDQRGFGETPQRGIWAGEENLTQDLASAVTQAQKKYPNTPVYILAESMGGAVAIVALSQHDFPKVNGVILSAPAVWGDEAMNLIFRGTLWLSAHTFPWMAFTGSDLKIRASDNIPMLRALSADPMVIKKTRIDAVYGLVGLMGDAYMSVPNVSVPTLLLYGDHDQVIPAEAIRSAIPRFSTNVRVVWYPEGYHMLLRDLQRKRVYTDILHWIHKPNAPIASGFEKRAE